MPSPPLDAERLSEVLRALASPVRLRLLEAVREPTRPVDVRLRAGEERAGFSADRILSRPAIVQHLQVLEAAGLVRKVDAEGYVVDQAGMLEVLRDLGGLARLRPVALPDLDRTVASAPPATASDLPARPRVLVVGGPDEGRAFALAGPGPWRVGRDPACEVRLDYDPHVSRHHATLQREGLGFALHVAPAAKNAAGVDGTALATGERRRVPPAAVVTVGSTRLLVQP